MSQRPLSVRRMSVFTTTSNKGFQITFANGWTISVQWGPGNYCERQSVGNYDAPWHDDLWESETAEVAAWVGERQGGDWYDFDRHMMVPTSSYVSGYRTPDEVAEMIAEVAGK